MDEPPIQLEKCQQSHDKYYVNAAPKLPENCKQPTTKRITDNIPYEDVSQILTPDQKALMDIKGKYTDSEGYEIPQGCGHKLSKFKRDADSIAYENVPNLTEEQIILGRDATNIKQTNVQHGDIRFIDYTSLQRRILLEFPQVSGGDNENEREEGVYEASTLGAEDGEMKNNVYCVLIK